MRRAILVAGSATIFGVVAVACGSSDGGGGGPGTNDDASAADGPGANDTGTDGTSGTDGSGGDGSSDAPFDSGPPAVLPPGPMPIAAGYEYACAIGPAGALRCWGGARGEPITLAAGSTFTDVVGTSAIPAYDATAQLPSSCAIRADGALLCWGGWNTAPAVVGTGPYVKAALGPAGPPCALSTGGAITCWTGNPATPSAVGTDTDWAILAGGSGNMCALKTNGDLYCWTGAATPAHLLAGTKLKDLAQGAAGNLCAVEQDGTLACWGTISSSPTGTLKAIGSEKDWARVAVGYTNACALKTNGTLWCFGSNRYGELGRAAPPFSSSTPLQVGTDTDWTAVSASYDYACATKKDGSVRCWGSDGVGQLGRGTDHTVPVKVSGSYANISAGTDGACGASNAGAIVCWGYAGPIFSTGTVPLYDTPTTITTGGFARAFAGWSSLHEDACAIATTTSTLSCWGLNENGQVGTGAANNSTVAAPTSVGIPAKSVALGFDHTCAIHTDGSLYCWGQSSAGGAPSGDSATPVKVGTDTWTSLAAGLDSTCGIKSDGTTWCWSSKYTAPMQQIGSAGQYTALAFNVGALSLYTITAAGGVSGVGGLTFTGTFKALSAGGSHVCAVKSDNTLWCAGNGFYGQLGDGTIATTKLAAVQVGTATDWAEVAGGSQFTCGRRTNGDVYCWGNNASGQIGDGTAGSAVPVMVH